MSDSSVPTIVWGDEGLELPTDAEILAGVQADQNAAFGGNMNMALQTPQGQIAQSTTAIISDKNDNIAQIVNQVDPDNAQGFMQDAIGRIYFQNRKAGTATVVQGYCVGGLGTQIIAGVSQAKDTSGNIYVCTESGQIGVSGNITLPFANIVTGPVPCPAGTLSVVYYRGPLGAAWNTITNVADGVEGTDVESAADFEFRRQNSVAVNGHGSLPSIYGAVFAVDNVTDCYATENVTDDPVTVGSTNFTLKPHSLYVGVVGGAAADIAQAIWTKKNEGSNMNGNTTQTVVDESGYSYPYPSYPITFNDCTENPASINFIVTIVASSALPGTINTDITNAMKSQFIGQKNVVQANGVAPQTSGQRERIGALILAASYYGAVNTCEGPSVQVQVLQILIGSTFAGQATVTSGSNVLTVNAVTSGAVSVGDTVTMAGVPATAQIVQQLTGTAGGVGTYQMSLGATAGVGPAAVAMGGGTSAQMGIDQAPVFGTVTVVEV